MITAPHNAVSFPHVTFEGHFGSNHHSGSLGAPTTHDPGIVYLLCVSSPSAHGQGRISSTRAWNKWHLNWREKDTGAWAFTGSSQRYSQCIPGFSSPGAFTAASVTPVPACGDLHLFSPRHNDSIQCVSYNPITHQLASCSSSDFGRFWFLS